MMKRKKKPIKPLNTRILKKISERVKIEKGKKYVVSQRKSSDDEWRTVYSTASLKKALHRKHNAMHIVIRDLGYLGRLLERMKKRRK